MQALLVVLPLLMHFYKARERGRAVMNDVMHNTKAVTFSNISLFQKRPLECVFESPGAIRRGSKDDYHREDAAAEDVQD